MLKWSTIRLAGILGEREFLDRITLAVDETGTRIRCVYCRGKGVDGWGGMACHICHGERQVKVGAPLSRCAFCKGRGRPHPGMGMSCEVCGGRGVLTRPPRAERCLRCGGEGRIPAGYACPRCRGRGFSAAEVQSASDEF